MNKRPIFVLGLHKSGTSMLRSLLDSHPDLFSIPIETHFFQLMKYWVRYDYRKQQPGKMSREQIISGLDQWLKVYNNSTDRYADAVNKGFFDLKRFHQYLQELPEHCSHKEIMEKYYQGIYYALYNEELPEKIRIVEKSVENAEFAAELANMYPDAKFLHIIRNPYANMVSFRKYKSIVTGYPLINRIINSFYNDYYYLYKNLNLLDNYFVISYEKLVSQPRKEMNRIAEYLDIPFDSVLLNPTHLGESWGGNSMTDQSFNGIDSSRLQAWKGEIHPLEIYYLNKLFPFIFRDFGYEQLPDRRGRLLPAKGENLKRYIYNRLYAIYWKI